VKGKGRGEKDGQRVKGEGQKMGEAQRRVKGK